MWSWCFLAGGGAADGAWGGGHAEVGAGAVACDERVGLGEFGVSGGQADVEAFGFAEPALTVGLGDAGEQVVADLDDPGALLGVDAKQGAP